MVLESTVICVDNSDFMRNGDFLPTRFQAQQDAVNLVCHSKTRANPENNVGLLTLANPEVLATLTTDAGRLLAKLHQVQPCGNINLMTGMRIAHLVLKHRQGKNHKMRIVAFIGSPIEAEDKDIVRLGKKLKKEKVNIDLINFGEDVSNADKLTSLVNVINGNDGSGSHLVTVPPGPHLSDALLSSPVIQGEDGAGAVTLGSASGFEFGVDPNEDPELALALRVSMEEQRQRQEEEARKASSQSGEEAAKVPTIPEEKENSEDALLEKALAMSVENECAASSSPAKESKPAAKVVAPPNFASMTEEEQIAYAMQMSLQAQEEPMETEESTAGDSKKDNQNEDYSEVMSDPAFLQSVLQNLAGVDPQSEAVRNAIDSITQQKSDNDKEEEKK